MNHAGIAFGSPFGSTCNAHTQVSPLSSPNLHIGKTHLTTHKPSNTLLPVDPPEAVRQAHPPHGIRASSRRSSFNGEETAECPALRGVAGLRVELRGLVEKEGVCRRQAGAREVWPVGLVLLGAWK